MLRLQDFRRALSPAITSLPQSRLRSLNQFCMTRFWTSRFRTTSPTRTPSQPWILIRHTFQHQAQACHQLKAKISLPKSFPTSLKSSMTRAIVQQATARRKSRDKKAAKGVQSNYMLHRPICKNVLLAAQPAAQTVPSLVPDAMGPWYHCANYSNSIPTLLVNWSFRRPPIVQSGRRF